MIDDRTGYTLRRGVLRAGFVLLATGASTVVAFAQGDSKAAQNLVQYRDKPNGAAKCSGCSNFEAPNACKVVAGKIEPEGWCLLYVAKET